MKTREFIFILAVFLTISPGIFAQQESRTTSQPHARSQQEMDAYLAAKAVANGVTAEQTAVDFAARFPQSELRPYLFAHAMSQYQRENNAAGMLTMGERVLQLDPSQALALVLTATVLADSLTADDPDRDRKLAEIKGNAGRVIQGANINFTASQSSTPQQASMYKSTLQSMAHSALGLARLKTGDYAEAEKDLRTAADLTKIHPDASIWYHLALAQDHRKRYQAALNSVEQALQLASSNPELQRLAEIEHERLNRHTGHNKDSADSGGTPE